MLPLGKGIASQNTYLGEACGSHHPGVEVQSQTITEIKFSEAPGQASVLQEAAVQGR